MSVLRRTSVLWPFIVLVGCDGITQPAPDVISLSNGSGAVVASAEGGGHYLFAAIGDVDTQFSFSAEQNVDGTAHGQFHQRLTFLGFAIEVHGEVTCVSVDSENGRAWIGGVVTHNTSEEFVTGDIHQPGRDVWFRVLDSGEGNSAPADRTTFLGFEGGGGIITSAEYCEAQIWPDDNARTNPVSSGNIQVRP